jgi:hypothetical protein
MYVCMYVCMYVHSCEELVGNITYVSASPFDCRTSAHHCPQNVKAETTRDKICLPSCYKSSRPDTGRRGPTGLPDGTFSNQKSKFCRVFQWKTLVYYMPILSIICPFGLCIICPFGLIYANFVYFMPIWYISPRFKFVKNRQKWGNTHFWQK